MIIIDFFYGLFFGCLGLVAYLQFRRGGDFPLIKQLPWLAAFGFIYGTVGWVEMFMTGGITPGLVEILKLVRTILQPLSGLLLLIFGWGILTKLDPLPPWTIFIPGILIVPIAYVIAYAATTFITPSPIEIPIDIWSRYLLYLPGSIMAGIGFLRQWKKQGRLGYSDVSNLMLGAGLAFLFEAFVVGLVVPAAPYGPASYYNYDRALANAFTGEQMDARAAYGLMAWLDYQRVLEATGLPIQFWRLISAVAVTFFVVRGLDVFDAIRKRELSALQEERDKAQKSAFESQIRARQTAERWTDALVSISRRISELEDVDDILLYIIESARKLLKSDFIGIGLLNGQNPYPALKCFSTSRRTELVVSLLRVQNPLVLQSIQTSQPYRATVGECAEKFENLCFFDDEPVSRVAIVPLTLDTSPIGAMWIARAGDDAYSETDLIWLECLADQVVIAIKHGLMTAQLQSLSVIEERTRIAREMHDGLAQVLGYLNLQVQTLEALLDQGKMDRLSSELKAMHTSIQLAHADVRDSILTLRTTLDHGKGLLPAVVEYLEEFGIQTGIQVHFANHVDGDLNISSIAEVQLVCILQEALTNIRKHANSSQVEVLLTREKDLDGEYITLYVRDDGVGFSLSPSKRSFGLKTMRERAQSVQGKLVVQSVPGEGTSVECRLPRYHPEELERESV